MKKLALSASTLLASLGLFGFMTLTSAAGSNLIANPSVETANSSGTLPLSWNQGKWGTNTTAFTYKTTEGNTGTRSLYLSMTQRTSGDAKWYFSDVAVKPSQKYTYTEFYKSSVATEVDAQYTDTSGHLSYIWLNSPAASAGAYKPLSLSFTTPANIKTLTIFHAINKIGWLQTDDFSLTEDGSVAPVPPTVSITAPSANATVSGTTPLSATATDVIGMGGVQFKIDNTNIGTEDTTAPYSVNWDSKAAVNGTHTLTATARNSSNLTTSASVSFNVQNSVSPMAPTITFTAPAANDTVSGTTQTVSASASDVVGVLGVQFKLDGNNLGAEDTLAPYSINLDTTPLSNGSHILSAVARNGASLTTTATETINVQNIIPVVPGNLIANPSFETANGTTPASWQNSNWGTNSSTFSYLNTGHTGVHSVKVQTTSYTNGGANWFYSDVPVVAGKTYNYENWYQSNVDTEVDAEVLMNDGSTQYFWLGVVSANSNWTKFSANFTAPAGAKSMAIYQLLAKTGYIISDDYSLSEYVPLQFNRAMVSLTFDDAWRSQYTNGLPLLQKYNLAATFYLLTGITADPSYMTVAMMQALKDQGSEIASHTVTHPHLPQLSVTQMDAELANSQASLRQWFGPSVATNFATPYGEYNSSVLTEIKKYYSSHRGVEDGYNSKDSFNIYDIKVQNITSNTTPAQVQAWVNQAIANKYWLVLVYHEVGANVGGGIYHTNVSDLDQELNNMKQSGVAVETVNQAINEILPQL